ncbi:hypothetical protein BaRGS_00020008, partial [Batillaria attramentaria]
DRFRGENETEKGIYLGPIYLAPAPTRFLVPDRKRYPGNVSSLLVLSYTKQIIVNFPNVYFNGYD